MFGLSGAPSGSPGWAEIVRFAVGPVGQSPLSWLLIGASFLALLIARHERLFWAGRLWAIALLGWLGAFAVARHGFGSFAPSLDVLLAPAAAAVAATIGLGIAAFEIDLSDYRFGWRQVGSGAAVLALVIGLVPMVAKAGDGRWGLAETGYAQPLAFLAHQSAPSGFRVLWLGAPDALPLGGWSISPGLAYATSEDGVADADDVWAPAGPGPSVHLADALHPRARRQDQPSGPAPRARCGPLRRRRELRRSLHQWCANDHPRPTARRRGALAPRTR